MGPGCSAPEGTPLKYCGWQGAPCFAASAFFRLERGCELGVRLLGKREKRFLGLLAWGGGGKKNSIFFVCTEVAKKVSLGKS